MRARVQVLYTTNTDTLKYSFRLRIRFEKKNSIHAYYLLKCIKENGPLFAYKRDCFFVSLKNVLAKRGEVINFLKEELRNSFRRMRKV